VAAELGAVPHPAPPAPVLAGKPHAQLENRSGKSPLLGKAAPGAEQQLQPQVQASSPSDEAITCSLSPLELIAAGTGPAAAAQCDGGHIAGVGMVVASDGGILVPPPPPLPDQLEEGEMPPTHAELQPALPGSRAQRPPRATRNAGVSVGVQAGVACSLLPPSLLPATSAQQQGGSSPASVSALSSQAGWWPAPQARLDALPPHLCVRGGAEGQEPASDARVRQLLAHASTLKRAADRQRGTGQWRWPTLRQYAEAGLAFMVAVDCLTQLPTTPENTAK
jgi:hypothetical protein